MPSSASLERQKRLARLKPRKSPPITFGCADLPPGLFQGNLAITIQRGVTYCYTSLESMNIGGCASLETRDGRHAAVRTNLMDLVDRKQITRD